MDRNTRVELHTDWTDFGRLLGVRIANTFPSGSIQRFAVAKPLEMVDVTDHDTYQPPPATLHITRADAQQWMDALWHAGIRPTHGTGSAGQMAATEKHLEDMRALVFASANVEKPGK